MNRHPTARSHWNRTAVSVSNLGNVRSWTAVAPGTYNPIQGRFASAYLAADL